MKSLLAKFDPNATYNKIISLQLEPTNPDCQLECVFLTAEILSIVWTSRQANKRLDLATAIAKICAHAETLQKSAGCGSNGTNILAMIDV